MKSRFNKLSWQINSLFIFGSCLRSLMNFLFGLQQISYDNFPIVLLTIAEFVNLTLAGWLFFNFFARPGTLSLIPSEEIRNDREETSLMWTYTGLVYALRSTFYSLTLTYAGIGVIEIFNTQFESLKILCLSIPFVVVTTTQLIAKRRIKPTITLLSEELSKLSIQERAGQKLLALRNKEQQELALLVFQSQQLSRLTIQSLAYIVWLSLIVALLRQIIEELFVRL